MSTRFLWWWHYEHGKLMAKVLLLMLLGGLASAIGVAILARPAAAQCTGGVSTCPSASDLDNDDVFYVIEDGNSRKITLGGLKGELDVVDSFEGRTGAVTSTAGDYAISEITATWGAGLDRSSDTVAFDFIELSEDVSPDSTDWIVIEQSGGGTFNKVQIGNLPGGAVDSVFGRTGTVTATSGDYDISEVTATWGDGLDISTTTLTLDFVELTENASPATNDWVVVESNAGGTFRKVQLDNLPSAGGGITSVVEDTTPQLGGQLDVNGAAIGDGTRELLTFTEDGSAVNHLNIENQATGSGPILRSAGDDTDVDLTIACQGTCTVDFADAIDVTGNIVVSGTVDGRDLATDGTKLDGLEALADVTDATNVDAAGAVMEADFNAQTVLAATSDNTPAALTVGEATIVGRATGGNVAALTATQARTIINVEDGADVTDATNVNAAGAVMESDFDAQTILAATSDNTPAALTVAEQRFVGRITSGNVAALTAAQAQGILNGQAIAMADAALGRPLITDYAVESTGPSSSSGTLTLDLTTGNDFGVTLGENVTTITVSNWCPTGTLCKFSLGLTQDGTGSRTVAFPAGWNWPGGSVPTVTAAAASHDEFVVWSRDAGTTVYAATVGQDFN